MKRQVNDHARDLRSVLSSNLGFDMLVDGSSNELLLVLGGSLHEGWRAEHTLDLLGIGLSSNNVSIHLMGGLHHRVLLLMVHGHSVGMIRLLGRARLDRCAHWVGLHPIPHRPCVVVSVIVELSILLNVVTEASTSRGSLLPLILRPLVLIHATHEQPKCL